MNVPFNSRTRKALLEQYTRSRDWIRELEFQSVIGETPSPAGDEAGELLSALRDLARTYEKGLPRVTISRCPFTGDPVVHSLDTFGLDGLWWDYEAPVRPVEALPDTLHSLTGSLSLAEQPEMTTFVARPGPDVPFILPGLLGEPSVVAVVSSVRIGEHTGYPVCYFTRSPETVEFQPNSWGAGERLERRGIVNGWSSREPSVSEMDFDIGPWIRAEKLGWIGPDDTGAEIMTTSNDCPYIGIEGKRKPQTVFRGKVTYG